jgi:acyl carrier protein
MNTTDQLSQLIHDKFGIAITEIQPDLAFSEYGFDSLTLAEFLFTVEDEFSVRLPDRADGIDTLSGLASLVDELRQHGVS